MPYPEPFIAPMRAELAQLGVEELRTPADVDAAATQSGVPMIVVNSICGCSAGRSRLKRSSGMSGERLPLVSLSSAPLSRLAVHVDRSSAAISSREAPDRNARLTSTPSVA